MTRSVEMLFDFVSPNAYLVWHPLREMLAFQGAGLVVTPVFLGGMHRLTGNAPPMIRDKDIKGKNAYSALEMRRWIEKYDLSRYRMNPKFPFNSLTMQRMLSAVEDERRIEFIDLLLPQLWEEALDPDDTEELAIVLQSGGFDCEDLLARAQDPTIKQRLVDNTGNAVARGAFGVPTFYIGEEMFFGKERLGQMEDMLASMKGP